MQALRSRLTAGLLRPKAVRHGSGMGGHSIEHAIAETDKWKKISYVFMPFCVCYGVFVYIKHNQHHHEHEDEPPQYPWMKKRDKEMPWTLAGGSKCDLFDYTSSCAIKHYKDKADKAAKLAAA